MCWTTRNKPVKKIARQDIPVFKIVMYKKIYTDDEITMKITSYFQGYEYALGKQVECEMIIETKTLSSSPHIYTGFHSYDMKLRKSISHIDESEGIYIYGLDGRLIQSYSTYSSATYGSAIMHCVIPVGSEYYENERGEIVSNQIKPISIEEI